MHTRLATIRDLHRLTTITVSSLQDDPAFDYMWRYRHQFPEDNFFFWQLTLERLIYDVKTVFLVMVLDANDTDLKTDDVPDTIISYIIWVREGTSEEAKKRHAEKSTWLNMVDRTTAKVREWSISKKYTRRDADPVRLKAVDEADAEIDRKYFADLVEFWYIKLLVTHRDFRRRGAAAALVNEGLGLVDTDEVCSRVAASPMGLVVYKAYGFREIELCVVKVPGEKETLEFTAMYRGVGGGK